MSEETPQRPTSRRVSGRLPVRRVPVRVAPTREPSRPVITPPPEKRPRRRIALIVTGVVVAVIALTVGLSYYFIYVAPLQATIIKVNDTSVNVGYFLRRLKYTSPDRDIFSLMQKITNEILIRQGAPRLGIEVTPQEIDEALRAAARGENESISEAEFNKWLRDQLNETHLSKAEFRELQATSMLASRLQDYLARQTPAAVEQVHLHLLVVENYEDALKAKERLGNGEEFASVARDMSTLANVVETGGDIGWLPLKALPSELRWVFYLEPGEVSEPVIYDEQTGSFAIYLVSEREEAREIDDAVMPLVKANLLQDWLTKEASNQKITFHGRKNGFDSETYTWLMWQLERQ